MRAQSLKSAGVRRRRGLGCLICQRSALVFKGHGRRHLYPSICAACIKALISTGLVTARSSVINAFSIIVRLFLHPERPDWEQGANAGLPCLGRAICITRVPEQAAETFFLELIHFGGYKYYVNLRAKTAQ